MAAGIRIIVPPDANDNDDNGVKRGSAMPSRKFEYGYEIKALTKENMKDELMTIVRQDFGDSYNRPDSETPFIMRIMKSLPRLISDEATYNYAVKAREQYNDYIRYSVSEFQYQMWEKTGKIERMQGPEIIYRPKKGMSLAEATVKKQKEAYGTLSEPKVLEENTGNEEYREMEPFEDSMYDGIEEIDPNKPWYPTNTPEMLKLHNLALAEVVRRGGPTPGMLEDSKNLTTLEYLRELNKAHGQEIFDLSEGIPKAFRNIPNWRDHVKHGVPLDDLMSDRFTDEVADKLRVYFEVLDRTHLQDSGEYTDVSVPHDEYQRNKFLKEFVQKAIVQYDLPMTKYKNLSLNQALKMIQYDVLLGPQSTWDGKYIQSYTDKTVDSKTNKGTPSPYEKFYSKKFMRKFGKLLDTDAKKQKKKCKKIWKNICKLEEEIIEMMNDYRHYKPARHIDDKEWYSEELKPLVRAHTDLVQIYEIEYDSLQRWLEEEMLEKAARQEQKRIEKLDKEERKAIQKASEQALQEAGIPGYRSSSDGSNTSVLESFDEDNKGKKNKNKNKGKKDKKAKLVIETANGVQMTEEEQMKLIAYIQGIFKKIEDNPEYLMTPECQNILRAIDNIAGTKLEKDFKGKTKELKKFEKEERKRRKEMENNVEGYNEDPDVEEQNRFESELSSKNSVLNYMMQKFLEEDRRKAQEENNKEEE